MPRRATAAEARPHSDQRFGPRVAAYIPVQLTLAGSEAPLRARSRDLGTGGLCVATASPFDAADVRQVSIEFPGAAVSIQAQACWQRKVEDEDAVLTGIRFTNTTPEMRRQLAETVQRRAYELAYFLDEGDSLPGLQLDDCMELVLFSRLRQIPSNRTIYRRGDLGTESLFTVFRGAVHVVDGDHEERRLVLQGQSFGGTSLITDMPSLTTCVTVEPTQLLEVDVFAFRFIELARPLLARRVQRAILGSLLGRAEPESASG